MWKEGAGDDLFLAFEPEFNASIAPRSSFLSFQSLGSVEEAASESEAGSAEKWFSLTKLGRREGARGRGCLFRDGHRGPPRTTGAATSQLPLITLHRGSERARGSAVASLEP